MKETWIKVQQSDFDIAASVEWLQSADATYGAMVTFTGVVRDTAEQDLQAMVLEHYPGMTEKALASIVERARERWPLGRVNVIHRVGQLHLDDNIVFVGVTSAHRVAAFEASQFIMDFLKKEAPFWKREVTAKGSEWVAQKSTDLDAAAKW
ncbi:MAG: molybdopterin synthase catalytic subunit MoaE [Pseudomonadales bacterium]